MGTHQHWRASAAALSLGLWSVLAVCVVCEEVGGSQSSIVLPAAVPGDPGFGPQHAVPSSTTPPFLLVHLPKCAGTSARNVLFGIMRGEGRHAWEMCIPGTPATPSYTILNVSHCGPREEGKVAPLTHGFAVAAGHFNYEWTASVLAGFAAGNIPPGTNVPCLTYIRPPVERLISFFYWAHARSNKTAPILQDLPPQDALRLLRTTALRTFHYHHVPMLTLFGNLTRRSLFRREEEAMDQAAAKAREGLSKCVVGNTQDGAATNALLGYYFPWLAEHLKLDEIPRLNERRAAGSPQRKPLPPVTEALIREHYAHEMQLYDYALAVHRAQVAAVRAMAARDRPGAP